MIYNAVLVSGVQQSESVIHIHISRSVFKKQYIMLNKTDITLLDSKREHNV